jgi:hypothetical protein
MAAPHATLKKPKLEESIAKLKEIQLCIKQNLSNLNKTLEMLDTKSDLHYNLDNLKKDVESRASDLEAEVNRLREDLKSIRELLGLNLEQQNSGKS